MLPYIRSDLAQLTAYTPHPGGISGEPVQSHMLDRLDTNESPFDLPVELKQKLSLTFEQIIESNRYPDGAYIALKQAIADYVNESGSPAQVMPDWISVGNGSDELIRSVLIATCLGGEGSILVANPTFSMYAILAQTLGIPVVSVGRSQANFEIDLAAAQKAICTPDAGANAQTENPPIRVVFAVHPNSPTANALTANELDWLKSLPESILVVIDEAYFEFSQNTVVGELCRRPNWVVLRTFSKAFRLAAHRVGYAIAHPELIAALEKIRLPYNLPSFSQAAAMVALCERQQLLASVSQILAEREQLIANLAQYPGIKVWPSAANFIFLRLGAGGENDLAQRLKAQGTLIRHTGGGLRLTVGTSEENQRSRARLQAALTSSHRSSSAAI
jgi:histidinol-phosphate aminotransferase